MAVSDKPSLFDEPRYSSGTAGADTPELTYGPLDEDIGGGYDTVDDAEPRSEPEGPVDVILAATPVDDPEPSAQALGGPDTAIDVAVVREPRDESVLFVTNRFNVIDAVTAGLIRPRRAFGKYYSDLLAINPARIPLFRSGVSEEVSRFVNAEDDHAYPVLLEVSTRHLATREVPALSADGSVGTGSVGTGTAVGWAPAGVIPFGAVGSIVFRSEAERSELADRSTPARNVDLGGLDMVVDPGRFTVGGSPGIAAVEAWLKRIPKPTNPSESDVRLWDRIAGAVGLAAQAAAPTKENVEFLLGLLIDGQPVPKTSAMPLWLRATSLRGGKPERHRQPDVSRVMGRAIVDAIVASDPAVKWRPSEILATVRGAVASHEWGEEAAVAERSLEYIRAVVNNEREIAPFTPRGHQAAARAFLMFLLRPEQDRAMNAGTVFTGARPPELVATAAFSGALVGMSQLFVEHRPPGLVELLGAMEAAAINRRVKDAVFHADPGQVATVRSAISAAGTGQVAIDYLDAFSAEVARPLTLEELLLELDADMIDENVCVEIAAARGWADDSVWTVIDAQPARSAKERAMGEGGAVFKGRQTPRYLLDHAAFLGHVTEHGVVDDAKGSHRRHLVEHLRTDRSKPVPTGD